MDMYIITGPEGSVPEARWTLREAQDLVEERHTNCDLSFEESPGLGADAWMAYNWSDVDADNRAAKIPETIVQITVPGWPSKVSQSRQFFDEAVRMEMRVTTKTGVTSMEHIESGLVWDSVDLGRGFLIEQFAARAGRALADHLTKGELR